MGLLPALWSGGDSALQALSPVVQGAKAWGRSAQAMGRAVVSGPPSQQLLPVAGLDAVSAQSVFFALKQALDGPEGVHVMEAWLQALQLAQAASDRLLLDMQHTQQNLLFWRARMRSGGNHAFMLLGQGPAEFALGLLAAARLAPGRASAADRIEDKVLALQALTSDLAAALAAVHQAADGLRVLGAAATAEQLQPEQLLQATTQAVHQCLLTMSSALHELLPGAAQLDTPSAPMTVRRSALAQSFSGSMRVRGASDSSGASWMPEPQLQQHVAGAPSVSALQQEVQQLTDLLGLDASWLTCQPWSMHAALERSHTAAVRRGRLIHVPHWARMPSRYQRHWLKYLAGAGIGGWALMFLVRHSPLAGSNDLENWAAEAGTTLAESWRAHIVDPLYAVRDELFKTFRERPSIVSSAEFEEDKRSLLRMLHDFERDRRGGGGGSALAGGRGSNASSGPSGGGAGSSGVSGSGGGAPFEAALAEGMGAVMACYEQEMRQPIRNMVAGDLVRTLLIQVQRLKIDTEAAMLELDQVLRANELSISLVAAVPSLLVAGALLRALAGLLARRPPDAKREAVPCRMAMVELGGALRTLEQRPCAEEAGLVVYKLYKVYREAARLYFMRDTTSRYSEWPLLHADLLDLARPGGAAAVRLELQQRMVRSYALFTP